MTRAIKGRNQTAREEQLRYRARGNPPGTLPSSAISNCFPGLEFDFRNIWRRVLEGIVLLENNNYVVEAESAAFEDLVGHRLLAIAGKAVVTQMRGPRRPGDPTNALLTTEQNAEAVAFMEWSNALAHVLARFQGKQVECVFTEKPSPKERAYPLPSDEKPITRMLGVRTFFEVDQAVISKALAEPGELTWGLCSPWQNDYRECACYYWAASRPDYVNVEPTEAGLSRGDNWMQRERPADSREYLLDDRKDSRLVSYDDLFSAWEAHLRFVIAGRDRDQ